MGGKVYFLRMSSTNFFKVGYTAGEVQSRARALQTGAPGRLAVYAVVESNNAWLLERRVHRDLSAHKTDGGDEWFEIEPSELNDYLARLQKETGDEWIAGYYREEDKIARLYANYVRPLCGGQQNSIAGGSKDVLFAGNKNLVSAKGKCVIVSERQEFDICGETHWRTRLQELGKRALGIRDD